VAAKALSCFNQLPTPSKIIKQVGGATLETLSGLIDYSVTTKQGYTDSWGFTMTVVDTQTLIDPNPDFINNLSLGLKYKIHKEDTNPMIGQVTASL
jgi:hypothetical protein